MVYEKKEKRKKDGIAESSYPRSHIGTMWKQVSPTFLI